MTQTASSFNFPRVEARKCSCCSQPLTTGFGFSVPYIGTVGPKCVHKFAALAGALSQMDGLTVPASTLALGRLRLNLVGLGYEAQIVTEADGRWTLKIRARTRTDADKVCQTWEERREEFERDLKAAGVQLEATTPTEAPALDEAAIAGMSLPERRAVALEHGVRKASGAASTSVALIWAAVQAAQASAPAMRDLPSMAVRLTRGRPWAGRTVTELARLRGTWVTRAQARRAVGGRCVPLTRYEQVEQRQMSAVAVATTYPEAECEKCGALLNALGGCPVCDQEEVELNFAEAAAEARSSHHVPSASFSEDADADAAHCGYCGWTHEQCHCPHAQEEQQQARGGTATCTSCGHERADPRQTCRCCQGAVCVRCVAYDEYGTLYCADCLAESLAADVDDAEGSW